MASSGGDVDRSQATEFEQFVTANGPRLLRTAVLLTGDHGHAEDLVQVTLERVARRWGRLDGVPEAYARVVLARLATDRWRRLRSRVAEVLVEPPATGLYDTAERVVIRQALIRALSLLTPRQRAVLVLRFFEDYTEAQTAQALGVSVGTVKSTTSRATARLRAIVPELAYDSPAQKVRQ
jgi:RNA polymerase sigma-70 factor (sigma-E family)